MPYLHYNMHELNDIFGIKYKFLEEKYHFIEIKFWSL